MKIEFFNFPGNEGTAARAIRMIDECDGVEVNETKFAVVKYYPRDGDEGCEFRMLDDGESIEDAVERAVFWRGEEENDEYDRVVISQNNNTDGYIISLYLDTEDPWLKVFLVPVEKQAKNENKEV